MGRKIVQNVLMIFMIFFLLAGSSVISYAGEDAGKGKDEKAAVTGVQKEEVDLKIGAISGKTAMIELINSASVRGLQFTVQGAKMTELRTTSRSAGFLAKFNETNGIVIMASTSDDMITPGEGAIAELVCEKTPGAEVRLSEITLVGEDKRVLKSPNKK